MEVRNVLHLPVHEASQVGDARRKVARWTEMLGFDETCAGKVSIIVTEAAGNLSKHTVAGGELLVRALARGDVPGIEVLSLDRGPGIGDLARALSDGFSTAGSPGTGLGAMSRLADEFGIHSVRSVGTAILARLWSRTPAPIARGMLDVGVINLPMPGEDSCGDSWAVDLHPGRSKITVVDGLGHGPDAAEAARLAIRAFRTHVRESPSRIIERMHDALRASRGAAVAVVDIDNEAGTIQYAGVGNISGAVVSGSETKNMISHSGTVGHQLHKVQEFSYPWPEGALLVMHSDGITQRWDLERYPGLASRDPALLAGVLYRDFTRGRDDTTVLVARRAPAP